MNPSLENTAVTSLSWRGITVAVPERNAKSSKKILEDVSGHVGAGEMMAIMGPSGSGKTTLLNVLAHREASSSKARVSSRILVNGQETSQAYLQKFSRYVGSEDVLIGSLTVMETLYFAAQLTLASSITPAERECRIHELLHAFGLRSQANTIIGTWVKNGISTGQKRRLSVASQLISAPKILFLDEPTSGLDSTASFKVMSYVRDVAKAHNLIVISSIHQPSSATFGLFDKVLLLSEGKTCYFGNVENLKPYFDGLGYPMPVLTNPADFVLDLTNVDFERDTDTAYGKLAIIQNAWTVSTSSSTTSSPRLDADVKLEDSNINYIKFHTTNKNALFGNTLTLLHRSWIKSRRDVLVYGVRFAMYLGLAVMMGTVWLRLQPTQENIQPLANCILFGSAFMSFMAVVYVPAFIEDRLIYITDRENGLYGSTAFMISNFLIGLPYLFVISLTSSALVYWLVNFRPEGTAFMVWVMWMFLNLVAAESLVILMSCLFPNFVGALALTAMANGIWMACNGFMVTPPLLNVFYHYVFYYINYQGYVFRGLVTNEFGYRNYSCNSQCYCQFDTPLRDECLVAGTGVLQQYGFEAGNQGKWVGIMIGIIAVIRLMGWAAMEWKR